MASLQPNRTRVRLHCIPNRSPALSAAAHRPAQAMLFLRVAVAALLFVHGVFRAATGGVAPFGEFLDSRHIPAGLVVAWGITVGEIGGTVLLAFGRGVRPLALWFSAQLGMGIVLVHGPEGWFVVGGGRNGMEYSVTLIALLLAQAWAAPGRTGGAAPA